MAIWRARRSTDRRRGRRGTALVETALALPFLGLLLTGSAQVGTMAYGLVTVDTSAREGARIGSENPRSALDFVAGQPGQSYTCSGPADTNSVCDGVYNARGLLTASALHVTVSVSGTLSLAPANVFRAGLRTTNANCNGSQATIVGVVSNLPAGATSATVTSSLGASSGPTGSDGSYSFCSAEGNPILTATASGQCVATASQTVNNVVRHNTYTVNFTLSSCTTSTTTTSSSTSTTTSSGTFTPPPPAGGPGSFSCTTGLVSDSAYVTVAVTYQVPIFVPFVDKIFADPGTSHRTISTSVTMKVEPCQVTGSQ